ncbi:MAG: MmcQ/YjbR family DNA-binding protein [Myxococcota bacterium]
MLTWETVKELCRELPGVEEGIWFRTPAMKVKGKSFTRLKEDGETLVVMVPEVEKDILLAARPDVFFQTDHYVGWPAMLIRLKKVSRPALRERLVVAWKLYAPTKLLKELEGTAPASPARKRVARKRVGRRGREA